VALARAACCTKSKIERVGCENQAYGTKEFIKYKMVKRMVDPGTKGGVPYEVEGKSAYTETVKVK
jgi:hypothetical protein